MEHAALTYADPLETAVAIEEAVVRDRDFRSLVLDKADVHVKPHGSPFRISIEVCGVAQQQMFVR